MLDKTTGIMSKAQSRLQLGFTFSCSLVHAAVLITETVARVKDQQVSLIITYMDASKAFHEGQGIRQCRVTSTELFKAWANPLLHRLNAHPEAFRIGTVTTGAVMVADDLALITDRRCNF